MNPVSLWALKLPPPVPPVCRYVCAVALLVWIR
jgi:hypothetical protein